ncbi:Protein kinase domain family protein [Leishmania donovani]|uniref:Protein kinase domain family protein n=1 Tax=Leishmania donovani TaxID=5661 RepID=A0A504XMD8_LEIDO|nr:Protein kinase domain family protein [Leishmania donovani]
MTSYGIDGEVEQRYEFSDIGSGATESSGVLSTAARASALPQKANDIDCTVFELIETDLTAIIRKNLLQRDTSASSPISYFAHGFDNEQEFLDLTDYIATRWYRSPEILVKSRAYSTAMDMWAIGCVIGEMLLGHPLFEAETRWITRLIVEAIGVPSDADLIVFNPRGGFRVEALQHPYVAPFVQLVNWRNPRPTTRAALVDEKTDGHQSHRDRLAAEYWARTQAKLNAAQQQRGRQLRRQQRLQATAGTCQLSLCLSARHRCSLGKCIP